MSLARVRRGLTRLMAPVLSAVQRFRERGRLMLCLATGRPLILFELQATGLREHAHPVVSRLLREGHFAVVAVVPDGEWDDYQRDLPPDSRTWRFAAARQSTLATTRCSPKVVVSFHPENGSVLARRFANTDACRVVMQHGLSDKVVFSDRERDDPLDDFDVVFLSGPVFREGSLRSYCERHPETCKRLRFVDVGSPKTDRLFNGALSRTAVIRELGMDPSLPAVVYAPTWERWASLERCGAEIIAELASLPVNVIVKLHHVSLCRSAADWIMKDGHGGKDWRAILRELERMHPNVRLAVGHDAAPYLVAGDVLVSDASGVAYEFVLLDKPVVFFDVPELFDVYGKDGIHYWGRECGDVVSDTTSLREVVRLSLQQPSRRALQRHEWIPKISYSRGDATRKACQAIEQLAAASRSGGIRSVRSAGAQG